MRQEEIILETENAKVRIIEIQKNTSSQWHHHTEITDNCFCLVGEIKIHTKNPDITTILKPGERYTITAGVIHSIENTTITNAKVLLVQGIGKLDFVTANLKQIV